MVKAAGVKCLLLGPYVGDFAQEVMTFRPYVRWISRVIEHERSFVKTHSNRFFLYDFVDEKIPVGEALTEREDLQDHYYHLGLDKKVFGAEVKGFKALVAERFGARKRECRQYSLNYIKSPQPYSIYQKVFEPVPVPAVDVGRDLSETVVLIPADCESEDVLRRVHEGLSRNHDVLVVGDGKTRLGDLNVLSKREDYTENVYKYVVRCLSEAKAVVCPGSHWTFLANVQRVPVFSWGNDVGPYKKGGCYYFGNNKSSVMAVGDDVNPSTIVNQVGWFLESKSSRLRQFIMRAG
jgi:hypothetical protein